MKAFRGWLKRADEWAFGFDTPHAMALLRILFGFLGFANFVMISIGFHDWFGMNGYLPPEMSRIMFGESWRVNFFMLSPNDTVTLIMYAVLALSCLFTCLGLFTRLSSVIMAIGVVSLHHRSGQILHGGDTMLRMMALYLTLMPSGRVWSLDRWMALRAGKPDPAESLVSQWPVRLCAIQVAIVYFTTVWHKWGGDYWRDGSAVWYPLNLNEFDRFWLPDIVFSEVFIKITSYGTLLTEIALATLVFFKPFRKWVVLAGIGMHAFIEYSMNIPLFAFIMVAAYVSFYEGREVKAWAQNGLARLRSKPTLVPVESGHVQTP